MQYDSSPAVRGRSVGAAQLTRQRLSNTGQVYNPPTQDRFYGTIDPQLLLSSPARSASATPSDTPRLPPLPRSKPRKASCKSVISRKPPGVVRDPGDLESELIVVRAREAGALQYIALLESKVSPYAVDLTMRSRLSRENWYCLGASGQNCKEG
jgi:hypothetical protein